LSVKKIGRGPRENFKTKDIASIKSIIAYYLSDDKYLNKKIKKLKPLIIKCSSL
jgi:hypothetical protein